MVLGIAFVLLVSLVLTAGVAAVGKLLGDALPGGTVLWQIVNFVLSFAVVTALFAAIYKVLPDATIDWSDVWIGAAVTSLLFTIGKLLIGLYLGHASIGSTFGAAGSLLVFLVWVYYSAQILFFGAEFTQVYARRYGSRIRPSEGAVALTEDARADQGIPHRETVERAAAEQRGGAPVLVAAGARGTGEADGQANGTSHRTNGHAVSTNGHAASGQASSGQAAKATRTYDTSKQERRPRGDGGTKGAPDAVKKIMWAGLVSGTMALGAVAARRASAGIWRGILHEDPPTKDI
jgi:hypothetical protein